MIDKIFPSKIYHFAWLFTVDYAWEIPLFFFSIYYLISILIQYLSN